MLTLKPSDYPEGLSRLYSVPKQLYASNDSFLSLMQMPRIGIVGSRKITSYGRAVTTKLSGDLANKGVVIVSGLALGVDSVAHNACLQAGGRTIAVLPAGLDKIYPVSHHNLAQELLAKGGALVTEYPPKTTPLRPNFVARNRIIAGLSEGLLITEAAIASGSLHTARFALEIGIPVFAVPGPITSPESEGVNNLIKTGAVPVTSVEDILNHMNWVVDTPKQQALLADTEEEQVILDLVSSGVSDGHELLIRSRLDAAKFNQALTMLEITGRIRPLGANHWGLS